ncbi:MAG: hypothetical protein ACYTEK_00025 [Planctomycetota bacterium]|jgi:hypothetical protein
MAARCIDEGLHAGSSEFQSHLRALRQIDFELAYLALLTYEGLKPLSRWEKPLDEGVLDLLQQMGLLTKQVRRGVKTGKEVVETVFSRTAAYIRLYEHCFSETPIDKSARTQRFEGFLFGYPPCCVSWFISHPYAPNGLNAQEQEILFHWACKDCKVTPLLARSYAGAHALISNC